MIPEWDVPFSLVTPAGTLALNTTDVVTGRRYQLAPKRCTSLLPVRSTEDDLPQADGKIPHRRWRSGFTSHLAIELLIGTDDEACDADLVAMVNELGLHVNSMIRTGLVSGYPNARLIWTPSGGVSTADDQMLDRCQLAAAPTLEDGDVGMSYEFDIDTPYPYYIAYTEETVVVGDTGAELVVNEGNTDYFPTVRVWGPYSSFVLLNDSVIDLDGNPLHLEYSAALPGAVAVDPTEFIEFNFFTGTAFLNGNQANRLAGIDFRESDFFPLIPGDNLIACVGATAEILNNSAWA